MYVLATEVTQDHLSDGLTECGGSIAMLDHEDHVGERLFVMRSAVFGAEVKVRRYVEQARTRGVPGNGVPEGYPACEADAASRPVVHDASRFAVTGPPDGVPA